MSSDNELERIKQEMLKRMMAPEAPKPSFWREGQVMTLTDANFHTVLGQTDKPVLVDFWAEWCGPCKMMGPIVSQMAAEYAGRAHFAKLNTDQNRGIASQFRVMSIPNFIVFKGGKPVGQTVGAVGKQGLASLIGRYL
jgi:thioredoxin 1